MAFHPGDQVTQVTELWDPPFSLEFFFFRPSAIRRHIQDGGRVIEELLSGGRTLQKWNTRAKGHISMRASPGETNELWNSFAFYSPILNLMSRYTTPRHSVYMSFQNNHGWQVQFLEPDLKTALPHQFTFLHADKIRELARRGEALGTLEGKQALEGAIENGRGGVYLRLTPEQYARLKRA